jgi:hypothetical protein
MNLTEHTEPARVLRNAVLGVDGIPQAKPGTRIVYHTGPTWSLSTHGRKVGAMARELSDLGRVILCQKKLLGADNYEWIAVVRRADDATA